MALLVVGTMGNFVFDRLSVVDYDIVSFNKESKGGML